MNKERTSSDRPESIIWYYLALVRVLAMIHPPKYGPKQARQDGRERRSQRKVSKAIWASEVKARMRSKTCHRYNTQHPVSINKMATRVRKDAQCHLLQERCRNACRGETHIGRRNGAPLDSMSKGGEVTLGGVYTIPTSLHSVILFTTHHNSTEWCVHFYK